MVTDNILKLVYSAQGQLGCEGCEENWPSLCDHECVFFGMHPPCRLYDYVSDYYEEAAELVDVDKVVDVFDVVNTYLNVNECCPFVLLTELIGSTIDQLNT